MVVFVLLVNLVVCGDSDLLLLLDIDILISDSSGIDNSGIDNSGSDNSGFLSSLGLISVSDFSDISLGDCEFDISLELFVCVVNVLIDILDEDEFVDL